MRPLFRKDRTWPLILLGCLMLIAGLLVPLGIVPQSTQSVQSAFTTWWLTFMAWGLAVFFFRQALLNRRFMSAGVISDSEIFRPRGFGK